MNTDTSVYTLDDLPGNGRGAWSNHFEFETITEAGGLDNNGVPTFKEIDVIKIYVNRDSGQPEIIPADPISYMRAHPECVSKVKPAYERWKADAEQPVTGYPLREIALLSKSVTLQFEHFGIRNAEQLITANEALVSKVPDGKRHQANVKRFMEAAEKRGEYVKLCKENEELKARLSAAETEIKKISDRWEESKKKGN